METRRPTEVEKTVETFTEFDFFKAAIGRRIHLEYLDRMIHQAQLVSVGKYTLLVKLTYEEPEEQNSIEQHLLVYKQSLKSIGLLDE